MADGALRKGGGASPRAQGSSIPNRDLSDFFAGKRFETGKAKLPKVMASRLGKGLGSNIYIYVSDAEKRLTL